jgi:hypothetical protein
MSEKQVSASGDDGHGAFLPIGSIVMWGGEKNKVPNGWLVCDGGTYTRKQYPLLADMIGANFGQPENPNADFYVPDLRGRFVRGVDEGLGRDPDRDAREDMRSKKVVGGKVGSVQNDDFRSHTHSYEHPLGSENSDKHFYSGNHWRPGPHNTSATGGKETRPVNAYLFFIIKAK